MWFLFGAALVPVAFHFFDLSMLVYAALSLTVVRVVPVALALVRAGLDRPTVLFLGWFGPGGLASVVFALLAVEELGETQPVGRAVGAVALTVVLSVVLHGISPGRSAGRTCDWNTRATPWMCRCHVARPRPGALAPQTDAARRYPDHGGNERARCPPVPEVSAKAARRVSGLALWRLI